jgi:predicted Rossmann fold nucleotide-binding protein DprA/Smf involved in DNA uptake
MSTLIAEGRARAVTSVPMVLGAVSAHTASTRAQTDPLGALIREALAAAPADPDALARRLGLSTAKLANVIARLVIAGEVVCGPDGRLARR